MIPLRLKEWAEDLLALEETKYGFNWGNAQVERMASHKGHRIFRIKTPRQELIIRVTPSRLIRIDE